MPRFRSTRLPSSKRSGWLGFTACALSQLTSIDFAMAQRRSSQERPSAAFRRESVSARSVDMAPCLVFEPTSSLSKHAKTEMLRSFSAARNASSAVYAQARSSNFGEEANSPAAPQMHGCWRLTRNRSRATMSLSEIPSSSAIIASKVDLPSAPAEKSGQRSTWRFGENCWLMSRWICGGMLGMSASGSADSYRRLSTRLPFFTITRPAIPRGLSNHV